jgi:hypothetical protein
MEPHLPLQPPPDAPSPPPGPEAIRSRKVMAAIYWIGGLSIVIPAVLILFAPLILRSRKKSTQTEATSNIKQLYLALLDFNADYGRFPDAATIADVQSKTHTTLPLGTATSNDYFRQLIAAETAKSETIFWAKTPATPRSPNNDMRGADALKKGECSFVYVAGLTASSDSETPIVMTPMIPGTFSFDPDAFGRKAVVLRIDGSAKAETIRTGDLKVAVPGGKTLFDPSLPHWGGKRPDLKWQE